MSQLLGVTLAILGSISTNFGNNLQKYVFNTRNEMFIYYKNKLWIIGFFLSIIGSICDMFALGNIAQSVAGTLGASGLLSNLLFSSCWLGENVGIHDIVATLLIIIGIVLIIIFGNHQNHSYNTDILIKYSYSISSICYVIIMIIIISFLYYKIYYMEKIKNELSMIHKKFNRGCYINPVEYTILIQNYEPLQLIHPIYLCIISGCFGGNSILFGKIYSELISNSYDTNNIQFLSIFGIISLCILISCVILQQHFLALSLMKFDASYVIPVFQCAFIITSIIGGGCYFQEFSGLTIHSLVGFYIGIVIIINGIYLLTKNKLNIKMNTLANFNYTILNEEDLDSIL